MLITLAIMSACGRPTMIRYTVRAAVITAAATRPASKVALVRRGTIVLIDDSPLKVTEA